MTAEHADFVQCLQGDRGGRPVVATRPEFESWSAEERTTSWAALAEFMTLSTAQRSGLITSVRYVAAASRLLPRHSVKATLRP